MFNAVSNHDTDNRPLSSKRDDIIMKKLMFLAVLPVLSACADSGGDSGSDNDAPATSRPVDMAVSGVQITPIRVADMDAFRIDDSDGFVDQLVLPTAGNIEGEQQFLTASLAYTAVAFTGENAIVAAGGGRFGEEFAVIDGITEALPTGNVTYRGHYTVAASDAIAGHGALDLQYAFFNNTLVGVSDDTRISVFGIVDNNGVVAGTVDFDGADFDLDGGIYGSNADEVAAGFSGSGLGGYVYGQRQ